jgi:hypothetical protein
MLRQHEGDAKVARKQYEGSTKAMRRQHESDATTARKRTSANQRDDAGAADLLEYLGDAVAAEVLHDLSRCVNFFEG